MLAEYGVTAPIAVIPTGLDLGDFAAATARSSAHSTGSRSERPVMLLVGRVAHEKNIHFLVHVLAEVRKSVPDVLFVIAGEGPALPA